MAEKKKEQCINQHCVLIGTYRSGQFESWQGYYNYPISEQDDMSSDLYSMIDELWLFSGKKSPLFRKAQFVGVKSRNELVRDYGYTPKGEGHGKKYLLFKTKPTYLPSNSISKKVIIRAKDFARTPSVAKKIKILLASDDRKDQPLLAQLPEVLLTIPPERLCVCEAAFQMDFLAQIFSPRIISVKKKPIAKKCVKFIDLFAGIGGIRKGFEIAASEEGFDSQCVFTSEIKPHAVKVLMQNHPEEEIYGDITCINADDIPDFDFLLAGFPCQAFSSAGKRLGFQDTRGTLFFDVERILKAKKPKGFILENVEGLVNHDKRNPNDRIGNTLSTVLEHLRDLGYKVAWRVLNAKDFGVPQDRKRIYIVGTKDSTPDLENFEEKHAIVEDVLECGLPPQKSRFIDLLLSHYSLEELHGRSVKDKRGGENNIHSWDIEYKGAVSVKEKALLNAILRERRKKKWAEIYGIDWMDGMPLTIDMIRSFFDVPGLTEMLKDLVEKKYLKYEHPKRKSGHSRIQDSTLPKGYNIVAGKMSFEVSKVLDPKDVAPTLVAMDMQHLFVPDSGGIRQLSLREGLRFFGYPESFKFDVDLHSGYDLLGNTVVVPVITSVANRVFKAIKHL